MELKELYEKYGQLKIQEKILVNQLQAVEKAIVENMNRPQKPTKENAEVKPETLKMGVQPKEVKK